MNKAVHFLRITALVEAVSYMLLVGIAMPLKYIWHQPMAVKVLGMIHGILFVLFCLALARAAFSAHWPLARTILVFLSSLIPFGPFLLDGLMKTWEKEHA
jgi:integral membrane protein